METVKERPILFSGPMVRALLAGRKTQTRRVITASHDFAVPDGGLRIYEAREIDDPRPLWHPKDPMETDCEDDGPFWKCPYGAPGDRLWVRENWQYAQTQYCRCPQGASPQPCDSYINGLGCASDRNEFVYAADGKAPKWRPCIHMPRRACRIVLEITDVRVERVNLISEADAISEGIVSQEFDIGEKPNPYGWGLPEWPESEFQIDAPNAFWHLFYGINKRADRTTNPFVWVVTFKKL